MKNITLILAALPVMLLAVCPARGADYITSYYGSEINWTRGYISSKGESSMEIESHGRPVDYYDMSDLSINRARLDTSARARDAALERLMSAAKFVRVDPERSFLDVLTGESFSRKRITETLTDHVRLRQYPRDFDSAVCEARLTMGDLISSLPFDFPSLDFPVIDDTPVKTDYTSLIVDGRGLGLQPMLFPSVYNEDGLEIFGRIYIDSRYASRYGMASYCYTEDEARAGKRAGRTPYFSVALKNLNGCPVISQRDARRILGSDRTRNNLKKCKVIFILDRKGQEKIAQRAQ